MGWIKIKEKLRLGLLYGLINVIIIYTISYYLFFIFNPCAEIGWFIPLGFMFIFCVWGFVIGFCAGYGIKF